MAGLAGRCVGALIAAAVLATPAAAAPCWTPEAIDAARVQQFETMLMSVSLRCRVVRVDLAAPFEHFRETHKVRLEHVMAVLGEHFAVDGSPQGKRELDRFIIHLANAFGGGHSDVATCQGFGAVLAELNGAVERQDVLESFALVMVRDPWLDGPRCPSSGSPARH